MNKFSCLNILDRFGRLSLRRTRPRPLVIQIFRNLHVEYVGRVSLWYHFQVYKEGEENILVLFDLFLPYSLHRVSSFLISPNRSNRHTKPRLTKGRVSEQRSRLLTLNTIENVVPQQYFLLNKGRGYKSRGECLPSLPKSSHPQVRKRNIRGFPTSPIRTPTNNCPVGKER